jgi:hypothetical protein
MRRIRRRNRRSRDRDFLREAQNESNWSSFTWHFRNPGSLRPRNLRSSYSTTQLFGGALVAAMAFSGIVFILSFVLRLVSHLLGGSD